MEPAGTDFGSNAARQASLKSKPSAETTSTDWWDYLGGSFLGSLGGAVGDSVEHVIAAWEQLTETSGFEQATAGDVDYEDMPEQITLPDSLNKGMQDSWSDSFPGGRSQEQGGIFVENTDGSQEWKRGSAGTSGSFSPNFGDADANERMLAVAHTHPYDKTEGGHTDVTFSSGDFASLVYQDSPQMDLMQSGDSQFGLVQSEEFRAKVDALDNDGKRALATEMRTMYTKEIRAAKGTFQERAEVAAQAVAEEYKIGYYKGQAGELSRVDTSN